ncbi:hypothetical protein A3Q56_07544 [Intoshia linei]|uniref:Tyr recombinase domain-containing protein n=1 Tax=Intoshia linei TaxID=1819745 RepID=A0A177ATP0_9BILA|nr:hypothetical protein A3Q56_07544 [Intoshia linei]
MFSLDDHHYRSTSLVWYHRSLNLVPKSAYSAMACPNCYMYLSTRLYFKGYYTLGGTAYYQMILLKVRTCVLETANPDIECLSLDKESISKFRELIGEMGIESDEVYSPIALKITLHRSNHLFNSYDIGYLKLHVKKEPQREGTLGEFLHRLAYDTSSAKPNNSYEIYQGKNEVTVEQTMDTMKEAIDRKVKAIKDMAKETQLKIISTLSYRMDNFFSSILKWTWTLIISDYIKLKNTKTESQWEKTLKKSGIPKFIARFLNLNNPSKYTGHCFRRSAATALAKTGFTTLTLKKQFSETKILKMSAASALSEEIDNVNLENQTTETILSLIIYEYATQLWNPTSIINIKKLESAQRFFLRRLSLLHSPLTSFKSRRDMLDLRLTYKFINRNKIKTIQTKTKSNIRKIFKNRCNTAINRTQFFNKIVNYWNRLPTSIVTAFHAPIFKKLLNKHFKD